MEKGLGGGLGEREAAAKKSSLVFASMNGQQPMTPTEAISAAALATGRGRAEQL